MATNKTAKKSKKAAPKKSPKKVVSRKKVAPKSRQQAETLAGCGEFDTHVEGSTLYITITGNAEFDADVVIEGEACRTTMPCRIVNGQWECS